jgi:hypothetical protein
VHHWFTKITRTRAFRAVLLALSLALAAAASALAQDTPGVAAPAGQSIVSFAWAGEASLDVITQDGKAYSVYRVELADSQWLPVAMPPSFTKLKVPGAKSKAVDIALSVDGSGLAVLEHAPEPLAAPSLGVYRWTAEGYRAVDTRQLPPDFWPAHMAWDSRGQLLYLAAREYLFPDQLYSIGALDAASGQFTNVMLKGNIDLVDELEYVPQRQALVVRSRGFQGEYPQQPVISLVELATKQFNILHSEAAGHAFTALADGRVIITGPPPQPGQLPGEVWVLDKAATQLSPAQESLPAPLSTLQITGDGTWLGFATPAKDGKGGPGALTFQRLADGKTVAAGQPCALYAFSPNGRYVCAVNAGRDGFTFYQLPVE